MIRYVSRVRSGLSCNGVNFRGIVTPITPPSTKTSILLRNLPPNITQDKLSTALAGIESRKVILEPGCAVHLLCEAEAHYIANRLKEKFDFRVRIMN